MKIKIFQVNLDRDEDRIAFMSYENIQQMTGLERIKSECYDKVFEGEVDCNNLEEVYEMFNINHPDGYRGRSLSVSDVVETEDEITGEKSYHFCDSLGFQEVEFDPENVKEIKRTTTITALRCRVGEYPEVVEIDRGLASLQAEVSGDIQQFMPFPEEVAIICDEEGKVNGKPLNRAVYDEDTNELVDIIAGDFLVVAAPYESENYESLSPESIEKYGKVFKNPQHFMRMGNEIVAIPYKPFGKEPKVQNARGKEDDAR